MAIEDTQSTDSLPWPRELSRRIGKNIQRLRESADPKLTARELADRTENLGHRVEYQVIANMESGRRANVPVADLLVLAAGLEVPPALLLCPLGQPDEVEPLPGWAVDAWAGFEWVTGFEAGSESRMTSEAMRLISTYHTHWVRLSKLSGPVADRRGAALKLAEVRERIRSAGWSLPPISEHHEDLIRDAEAHETNGRTLIGDDDG